MLLEARNFLRGCRLKPLVNRSQDRLFRTHRLAACQGERDSQEAEPRHFFPHVTLLGQQYRILPTGRNFTVSENENQSVQTFAGIHGQIDRLIFMISC